MTRPNIVVVLCDQLRRSALSCYGDPNIRTPQIDALAAGGVRFDAACSSYPVCVPFRFSMLTGQYAHSRQIPCINWRMSPHEPTLADTFNQAGYHTVYVGKWHLYGGSGPGFFKRPVPRPYQGRFEKWFGFEFRNDFFDTVYFEDDSTDPIGIDGYQTDGLFAQTADYLSTIDRNKPFFCMLSVEAPHPPFEAPEAYERAWQDCPLELPANFLTAAHHAGSAVTLDRDQLIRQMRIYYAMIQNLDDNIGRLVNSLRENNLYDNTIIVFLSDHGELMGSHNLKNKQYPYEESVGIPLIMWGPGCGLPQGQKIAHPCATEDLFPTLCGLANIDRDPHLPGQDVSTWFRSEDTEPSRPGVMLEFVAEFRPGAALYQQAWRGFRSTRYKYTVLAEHRSALKPWQFFDLQQDPFELRNLIDDPAWQTSIAQHHRWLYDRMQATGDHAWLAEAFETQPLNPWLVTTARG